MADYWMKLYIEILDDAKMATLPDRLWRRIIELFLVAKRENKEGHLPDTRQLAWLLRMNAEDLEHDLMSITSTGIIVKEAGGWLIPNFVKRQDASTSAERKAQERLKRQSREYHGDVTDQSRFVTQRQNTESETETETDTETEAEAKPDLSAAVFRAYSNNIGQLTKITSEKIDADIHEYTAEWVSLAIEEAVRHEKRSLAYVEGILKSWKRDGFKSGAKSSGNGSRPVRILTDAQGRTMEVT